jgi:hypothetical protein
MRIHLGKFSLEDWNGIFRKSSLTGDAGGRINFLSSKFLGVDYAESTLTGGKDIPEVLIINLREADCFTFLEYVEAMRRSDSFAAFTENLIKVRYRSAIPSFDMRNHFFTDWRDFNREFTEDITGKIGDRPAKSVRKILNEKEDGTLFLPGIPSVERIIDFIPADAIGGPLLHELKTGDYIGIYSHEKGLDVSHVGILIKEGDNISFRHASSQKEYRKVVDQDFRKYIAQTPGIIVLRPKTVYTTTP